MPVPLIEILTIGAGGFVIGSARSAVTDAARHEKRERREPRLVDV
jgi:hypothetical protein